MKIYLISLITLTSILFCQDEVNNNIIESAPFYNYPLTDIVDKTDYPKSIIFIIADGTGIGHYTLSYYSNGPFSPSRFDHIGLVATHPDNIECDVTCKRVTDSAASGTALSSGTKTNNGAVGINSNQEVVKTVLEWAEEIGMSTGLVATSTVTHATPASFASHVESRKMEHEIAAQFADMEIDVILGGGKKFWPDSLLNDYISNGVDFIDSIDDKYDENKRLLGLFSDGPLEPAYMNREISTTDMAKIAISKLDNNPLGFFVMIEESQVDWGGHQNNASYIKGEMESLNDLVDYCLNYQKSHPDVLVVLTADHECGGLSIHDSENGNIEAKFNSDYHSADFVPIWATGPGAEVFDSFMDNTMIGKQLIKYVVK